MDSVLSNLLRKVTLMQDNNVDIAIDDPLRIGSESKLLDVRILRQCNVYVRPHPEAARLHQRTEYPRFTIAVTGRMRIQPGDQPLKNLFPARFLARSFLFAGLVPKRELFGRSAHESILHLLWG